MSATTGPSDAQTAAATYDRMLAETRKFVAEQNKLADEGLKLRAEARKFDRERWAVYAAAIGGLVGGTAGIVTLLKAAGW
jgi:hypothetical protein